MARNSGVEVRQNHNVYKYDVYVVLLKAVGLLATLYFILVMPMGDPEVCCHQENIQIQANFSNDCKIATQSYACILHKVLSNAATSTNSIITQSSEFMACVMLNAVYDAKMKFYAMLQKVDKEDLCAAVTCTPKKGLNAISKYEETSAAKKETAQKHNACSCARKSCKNNCF